MKITDEIEENQQVLFELWPIRRIISDSDLVLLCR